MASSEDDNQASFGTNISRNDISCNNVDWTFTTCRILNISFRKVCYWKHCDASRQYVITVFQIMRSYINNHYQFYYQGVVSHTLLYGNPN